MEKTTRAAVFFNIAVVAGLGVWLFGQDPLPEQLVASASDSSVKLDGAEKQVVSLRDSGSQPGRQGQDGSLKNQTSKAGLKIPASQTGVETASTSARGAVDTLTIDGSSVRMRAGPSSNTNHLATYGRGDTFQKLDQRGKWVHVRNLADGTEGWIYQRYLKPQG